MSARSAPAHDDDDDAEGDAAGVVDAGIDADVDVDGGDLNGRLRVPLAAAFCRGRLGLGGTSAVSDVAALAAGRAAGLRLHRFKRAQPLPRVERVLSTLWALAPADLLDIGTGRGAFLWPLLEAFPHLPVRCVDVRADRVVDLNAVAEGGPFAVSAAVGDVCALDVDDGAVDVACALEVLEHVGDVDAAARELVRVARRFVLVTVPSVPDNNPEHIRLFTKDTLTALFVRAGAKKVVVDAVRGHFFAVVTIARGAP